MLQRALVFLFGFLLAACCGPKAHLHVVAYHAPTRVGSYGFRFVDWRPMPGRFTSDGRFEELPALGPVSLACRPAERCTVVGDDVTLRGDAARADAIEVIVTVPGFAPATVTVTSNDPTTRVVLLEPAGRP